jgi:hypothetical protein
MQPVRLQFDRPNGCCPERKFVALESSRLTFEFSGFGSGPSSA